MTKPNTDLIAVPVWDVFVRCFHWSLVTLFAISVTTGKIGGEWITWHMKSGYTILALVLFRVMWGFVGGEYARYRSFLAGPTRGIRFALELLKKHSQHAQHSQNIIGHNPVGGWMVIVLLLLLATQAILGLFGNDEIATTGPLARYISGEASVRAMGWHNRIGNVLLGLVGVHIVAVLFHVLVKKEGLIRAMFSGSKALPPALASEAAAARKASYPVGFIVLMIAIAAVTIAVNWSSIVKS